MEIWEKFYPASVKNIVYPEEPLFSILDKKSDKIALHYQGKDLSYSEIFEYTHQFASYLIERGYSKGDRLALFLPNSPQFVIAFFGALRAGLTVVPCSILLSPREIAYQLKDSSSKVLVTLKDLYTKILEATKDLPIETIEFDSIKFNKSIKSEFKVNINPKEDLATLLYTSGTTGKPKGIMLTHYNLLANAVMMAKWLDLKEEDVILAALPYSHSYGLTTCLNSPLYSGSKIVLMQRFNPLEAIELIDKHKVTVFFSVPTMLKSIADVCKIRLDSLRYCISGASPLTKDIYDQFSRLTKAEILEGYGLSEASPVTHCNPPGRSKFGSIGIPMPDTKAKIVEDGKELKFNEVGELIVKGPQVTKGYLNLEEETRNTLKDGWLYTGDLAKMDEEGYFYLVDRKKYMINVGGYKVYPKEVEDVLKEHPAIKEVAVVGVKDIYKGEKVKAYLVLKEGFEVKKEEILDFCKDKLAKYKIPEELEFLKDLPKTYTGKVKKELLIKT